MKKLKVELSSKFEHLDAKGYLSKAFTKSKNTASMGTSRIAEKHKLSVRWRSYTLPKMFLSKPLQVTEKLITV